MGVIPLRLYFVLHELSSMEILDYKLGRLWADISSVSRPSFVFAHPVYRCASEKLRCLHSGPGEMRWDEMRWDAAENWIRSPCCNARCYRYLARLAHLSPICFQHLRSSVLSCTCNFATTSPTDPWTFFPAPRSGPYTISPSAPSPSFRLSAQMLTEHMSWQTSYIQRQ